MKNVFTIMMIIAFGTLMEGNHGQLFVPTPFPTTKFPTTRAPTTRKPTTKAPTKSPTAPTSSPTTAKPTTKSPTTRSPTAPTKSPTKSPTTSSPTTAAPTPILYDVDVPCINFPFGNCGQGAMKLYKSATICACVFCPIGTFKEETEPPTKESCTACGLGSENKFCANSIAQGVSPGIDNCTFWTDTTILGPTQFTSSSYSSRNPYENTYLAFNALVFVDASTERKISTLVSNAIWGQERYGGLITLRNAQARCGTLSTSLSSLSLEVVTPGTVSGFFEISNSGDLPVNVTFSAPAYVTGFIPSLNQELSSSVPFVLDPGSTTLVRITVASESIPESDIIGSQRIVSKTITLTKSQYWSQFNNFANSEVTVQLNVTVISPKLLFSPSDLNIKLEADSVFERTISLFNVGDQVVNWTASFAFDHNDFTNWLRNESSSSNSMQQSCNCNPSDSCNAIIVPGDTSFRNDFRFSISSVGLLPGQYSARVRFNATGSGISEVPIVIDVAPGPANVTQTLFLFSPQVNEDNIRATNLLKFSIIPRDKDGFATQIFPFGKSASTIFYEVHWFKTSPEPCQSGKVCDFRFNVSNDNGVWEDFIVFPVRGTFTIDIKENGISRINGMPKTNLISNALDCFSFDSNSLAVEFGNRCICRNGYGTLSSSGVFVTCELCEPGHFGDRNISETCESCENGFVQPDSGQTECISCPSKAFEPNGLKTGCDPCPAGSVVNASGTNSFECQPCPSGQFASFGSASCAFCPTLNLVPNPQKSGCIFCGPGSVATIGDRGTCTSCPVGFIANPAVGHETCRRCPSAAFEPSPNSDFCVPCSLGTVFNSTLGRCDGCPVGSIAKLGDTECTVCPSNSEPNPANFGSCVPCDPGFAAVNFVCSQCPSGTFAKVGQLQCTPCESKRFQPNLNKDGCELCDPGFRFNVTGLNTCERCPAGTIAPPEAETCITCLDRTLQPNDDQTECVRCPENFLVPTDSQAWVCQACDADKIVRPDNRTADPNDYFCTCGPTFFNDFDSNGVAICTPCPVGAFCAYRFRDNLLPLSGYYKLPGKNVIFEKCPNVQSCPGVVIQDAADLANDLIIETRLAEYLAAAGPSNSSCEESQICSEGFEGPLCGRCRVGYTRVGISNCSPCLERNLMIGLITAGITVAVAGTIYIIHRAIMLTDSQSKEILLLKIMMSHMQIVSMSATFRFDWPEFVLRFFAIVEVISSAGQTLLSLDCLLDRPELTIEDLCPIDTVIDPDNNGIVDEDRFLTFYAEGTFFGSLPILWAILSGIFWFTHFVLQGRKRGRSVFNYWLITQIVFLFLLFPTVCRQSMRFFACSFETLGDDRLLQADFNILCWGPSHLRWALTVGLSMLILYIFFVPLGTFWALRKNVGKNTKYKAIYAFVFTGYKIERYYWEVVIMYRKAAFAFVSVVFAPFGSEIQGLCGLLIIVVALQLQAVFLPFDAPELNNAEFLGLIAQFITMFAGLFVASAELDPSGYVAPTLSGLVIAINVLFFLYVGRLLYKNSHLTVKNFVQTVKGGAKALRDSSNDAIVRISSRSLRLIPGEKSSDEKAVSSTESKAGGGGGSTEIVHKNTEDLASPTSAKDKFVRDISMRELSTDSAHENHQQTVPTELKSPYNRAALSKDKDKR